MKVLIVGGGGREHALAWKIRKSPHVSWLGCAPGNGGTRSLAEPVDVDPTDVDAVARYARDNDVTLTVIGPEAPLAEGIADAFDPERNFLFGPSKRAAQIESSKRFSKDLMQSAGIPTAQYRAFTDLAEAQAYVQRRRGPMVVKASGLAAGKGVYVCESREEASAALGDMMGEKIFGEAGNEVIVEEYLEGPEVSLLAITDGNEFMMLPPSQDHKRVGEGDKGPNTGGMGAYTPAPVMDDVLLERCGNEIIAPTLQALRENGTPYKGVLYAGLILTDDGPKVLEYNCRFGDPETQVVLPLLSVDLVDLMLMSAAGKIGSMQQQLNLTPSNWKRISRTGYAATVVLASKGYPGPYAKGQEITNLPKERDDLVVFHAGTKWEDGRLLTSGGRVLNVTAIGGTLNKALETAYEAADQIQFEGKFMRRDIGWRALNG
ncbi:phosphoribosylamine--glycine ligase [bacterium]|nr:phosphoribosylamine--glycine ligase [bacterium]